MPPTLHYPLLHLSEHSFDRAQATYFAETPRPALAMALFGQYTAVPYLLLPRAGYRVSGPASFRAHCTGLARSARRMVRAIRISLSDGVDLEVAWERIVFRAVSSSVLCPFASRNLDVWSGGRQSLRV